MIKRTLFAQNTYENLLYRGFWCVWGDTDVATIMSAILSLIGLYSYELFV